mmetsp:Transcript_44110/g.73216  ORF Transcript_44110/g.73216 Transcript_44110/m.73216 type:complete len:99 (-) Transcript_44110:103-399(-)|eukprot:CAMPEP_0119334078 /NCGR_PEP_ID=MMETSP1333-20130426/86606_1 /TAXON_ID=418940 /ORGANISM="Scyphosphaera apsteinii, Strain RCC1455" /LENGTH=98 /DNA_ID=CAMNT_0007344299 /DNA_START=42 /DNA_END=338 /DNA_ORIENTATION=-
MAGEEEQLAYLNAIKDENAKMEAEIAALTGKAFGATSNASKPTAPASSTQNGCIQIMNFGTSATASEAGVNNGSPWRPPVLGTMSKGSRSKVGDFWTG